MDFHDSRFHYLFTIMAIILCILVTISVYLFAPQIWKFCGKGKYASKHTLILGLFSAYIISSYSFLIRTLLPSDGSHSRLFFFECLWLFSIICSQIFKYLIFNHILYVLLLPTRRGDFNELLIQTEKDLILNAQRTTRIWKICCILFICVLLYLVIPTTYKKQHKSNHNYLFDAYSTCIGLWVHVILCLIIINILYSIDKNIRDRYVAHGILQRLRWLLFGEFICFCCTILILIILTMKMSNSPYKYLKDVDDDGFDYMMFISLISTIISLFTLFPLSIYIIISTLTEFIRKLLDYCDDCSQMIDDILCCRLECLRNSSDDQEEDERLNNNNNNSYQLMLNQNNKNNKNKNHKYNQKTILDFGFTNQSTGVLINSEHGGGFDVDISGEQTILREVGGALENSDMSSMIIPPEFLKIDAIPFASGCVSISVF